jgi:hypothetical protein
MPRRRNRKTYVTKKELDRLARFPWFAVILGMITGAVLALLVRYFFL